MSLVAYDVAKYRSFLDPTHVDVRPLTLLFGYNSAGKSALLRALPLVASSCDPNASGPLALESDVARGARFSDIRSRFEKGAFIEFAIEFSDDEMRMLAFRVFDVESSREQVVERLEISDNVGIMLSAVWSASVKADGSPAPRYTVTLRDAPETTATLGFLGLLPNTSDPALPPAATQLLARASQKLAAVRSSVHWLGSVRSPTERYAELITKPTRVQSTGESAGAVLAFDNLRGGRLVRRVSRWYEGATQHRLEISGDADRYSVLLSPLNAPLVRVNIVDTGEGMTQVLPVLVLLAQAAEGILGQNPILAIEHPELHLHPHAERELSKLVCSTVSSDSPDVNRVHTILETHSHQVLLSVQLAIVHGEIKPDDVLVYWVRELDNGQSAIDRITFDPLARPVGAAWPPGVFSEELDQARALALERMRRTRP